MYFCAQTMTPNIEKLVVLEKGKILNPKKVNQGVSELDILWKTI